MRRGGGVGVLVVLRARKGIRWGWRVRAVGLELERGIRAGSQILACLQCGCLEIEYSQVKYYL